MRTLETAITMGSATIRTNVLKAASAETLAEQISEAKPQADGRCDVVQEPTRNAPDGRHQ